MPPTVLYPMLLDQLIDRRVVVIAAKKQGLDRDPAVQRMVARATDTALQNALLTREIAPGLTDEAIKARYEKELAGKPGEPEIRARHILVADEDTAKKVIAELKGGADFATLAKTYSTDPGAQSGGDLGFFKKGDMLPEFSDAAFALKPGEITTTPVKTRFGWHVIKTEETRTAPPPALEQVRDEVRQSLIQEGVARVLTAAKTGLPIEKFIQTARRSRPSRRPAPCRRPTGPCPERQFRRSSLALPVSPLAIAMPELPALAGVRLGSAEAGVRYAGRTDLVMAVLPAGTTVAGVFTRNRCPGAPVDWCRAALAHGRARALVVNAGNANVFTGRAGIEAVDATAEAAADLLGCKAHEVFVASTGVIGEVLPHAKITAALPALFDTLTEDGWDAAARGIMTTDTFPKAVTRTAVIDGAPVRITGFAKGSGMVAPDMATMLAFVFTDAKLPASLLQKMLSAASSAALTARRSTATPAPATPSCCSRPDRPSTRPSARRIGSWPAASAMRWMKCCWTSRCRSCATARARRSWCAST